MNKTGLIMIILLVALVLFASLSAVGEFHWKSDLREQYDVAYSLGYTAGYAVGKMEAHREAEQPKTEPTTTEYGLGPYPGPPSLRQ